MAEIIRRLDSLEKRMTIFEKVIQRLPGWAFKTHAGEGKNG